MTLAGFEPGTTNHCTTKIEYYPAGLNILLFHIDSSGVQVGLTKQMNLFLRTKSDSGKRLSDAVSAEFIIFFNPPR